MNINALLLGVLAISLMVNAYLLSSPSVQSDFTPRHNYDYKAVKFANEDVVASVGEGGVDSLSYRMELVKQGVNFVPEQLAQHANKVINDLIQREALAQAAVGAGLDAAPETRDTIRRILAEQFMRRVRQDIATSEIPVSEEEIAKYYQQHIGDFSSPARVRVALIEFRKPANATVEQSDKIKASLESLHKRAEGASAQAFAKLALKNSHDSTSRKRGGDIGWLAEGTIDYRRPKALLDAVFALNDVGAVSGIIETDHKFFIARLTDRILARKPKLDEIREQIVAGLRLAQTTERTKSAIDEVLNTYEIRIDTDAIAAVGQSIIQKQKQSRELPPKFPVAN